MKRGLHQTRGETHARCAPERDSPHRCPCGGWLRLIIEVDSRSHYRDCAHTDKHYERHKHHASTRAAAAQIRRA
jgi:hypothetical protein